MSTSPSTGLVRGWAFRIVLLAMALCCLFVFAANANDHLQFSMHGVTATIERARINQQAPDSWSSYDGQTRGDFQVRAKDAAGTESVLTLYLGKAVVDELLQGRSKTIVFVRDNPRRFLMEGEPLPPFGLGWLAAAGVFMVVFAWSLTLR